jgi:sodium transport system permease protein
MSLSYSASDYAVVLVIILTTILLLVSLVSIISAFAKSVKEAATYVSPLMILVMLIGLSSMFGGLLGGASGEPSAAVFLIPLYNTVQAMSGVFKFSYSVTNVLITVVSNLVYACIGGFVLTRMFHSEKVIFTR